MGADVEIRQRRGPRTASPPAGEIGFPGEESGFPRQVLAFEERDGQQLVEVFDAAETYRNLGIDLRVD